jgi:hypothetical protein
MARVHGAEMKRRSSHELSGLATSYASSRGRFGSRRMSGGFSFKLSETQLRPRVVVKHHSSSLSFIQFAADPTDYIAKSVKKRGEKRIRRGYFLDLRTTARALTSELHSLESLTKELDVQQKKRKSLEHGQALTSSYIAYAVQDVEATWACFWPCSGNIKRTGFGAHLSTASTARLALERRI